MKPILTFFGKTFYHIVFKVSSNIYCFRWQQSCRQLSQSSKRTDAAALLHQIKMIPKMQLFPSQKKLLDKYESFLTLNFCPPGFSKNATDDFNIDNDYRELNEILAKIYLKNDSFSAYLDACLQTYEVHQAVRSIELIRKESRLPRNLSKGFFLQADIIFELLCRFYARKSDWLSLERTLTWLSADGLPISFKTLLASVECLGKLLTSPKRQKKMNLPEDQMFHAYICNKITEVLALAEKNNINVFEELLIYPRDNQSLKHIITALAYARPDITPKICFSVHDLAGTSKRSVEIAHRVSSALKSATFTATNNQAAIFSSSDAMVEAFKAQLNFEKIGTVDVTPVLPFFEDIGRIPVAQSADKQCSSQAAKKQSLYKKILNGEQILWRKQLLKAFEATMQRLKSAHTRSEITAYPFLKILPRYNLMDILIETINTIITDSELQHVSRSLFLIRLGQRVESACINWRKQNIGIIDELTATYRHYAQSFTSPERQVEHFREMWLQALHTRVDKGMSLDPEWPSWNSHIRLMVGQELYRMLYDHVTFDLNSTKRLVSGPSAHVRQEAPVLFEVASENPGDARCEIKVHPTLLRLYRQMGRPNLKFDVSQLPMLCPPLPWVNTKNAGYLLASSDATRFIRRTSYYPGADAAANDDLDFDAGSIPMVLDALNTLASCPWRVNGPILDAMVLVGSSGGDKTLSMPEVKTLPPIPPKKFDSSLSREQRAKAFKLAMDIRKDHDETRSLWASGMYRLSIANKYRDKVFWFPHSMDFRGRVYPCPPHFHHMGSDVARGLIVFAKGLPLGQRGLRWLKIHLANLTGQVKRSPNDDREAYTEGILDEVFDSADKPFDGRGWWREQEEPWQMLACCRELADALRHRDPKTGRSDPAAYMNHFPVHQDGSCNGLQHYAAIGRDERGALSVSLRDCERPRDVYTDVTQVVEAQRAVDAAAGMPVAQVLEGFVQRKVIKQSVMTTVYGVTLYGAMTQIRRQLKYLPEFPSQQWLGPASAYLARLTLASISAIFTSSSETQAWFGKLAKHITKERRCRVSWVTPLGLPVVQPYVKSSHADLEASLWSGTHNSGAGGDGAGGLDLATLTRVAALAERQRVAGGGSCGRRARDSLVGLPVPNPIKQHNAFPPNFIHSLDSCHMMLTALHCLREGVMFASVHDCFWTHAASIDQMNRICREEFVALHSEPVLENLSDYLREKFEYSQRELAGLCDKKRSAAENFNKLLLQIPKRGNFDLNEVLKSTFFFS